VENRSTGRLDEVVVVGGVIAKKGEKKNEKEKEKENVAALFSSECSFPGDTPGFEKTKTEARHPRNEKCVLYEFTNNNEMTRVGAQVINKHKIPHDLTLFPDPSFLSLALLSVPLFFLSCISNSA
jgi:hypothetical protein